MIAFRDAPDHGFAVQVNEREDCVVPPPDTTPRVTLPSDISGSLKYLDDVELRRLYAAVTAEMQSRSRPVSPSRAGARTGPLKEIAQIPDGKVNLIRASLAAGLKPGAIARTLGLSPAVVRRVLNFKESP